MFHGTLGVPRASLRGSTEVRTHTQHIPVICDGTTVLSVIGCSQLGPIGCRIVTPVQVRGFLQLRRLLQRSPVEGMYRKLNEKIIRKLMIRR